MEVTRGGASYDIMVENLLRLFTCTEKGALIIHSRLDQECVFRKYLGSILLLNLSLHNMGYFNAFLLCLYSTLKLITLTSP